MGFFLDKELQPKNDTETKKLEFRLRELELGVASQAAMESADFDVCNNICLVPSFNKGDVDKYLILFEQVAAVLEWPNKNVDTAVAECLDWQSRDTILPADDCLDFDKVKSAVLKA